MTRGTLIALAAAIPACGLVVLVLLRMLAREDQLAARLLSVQRSAGVDQVVLPRSLRWTLLQGLAWIGRLLTRSGILSAATVADLEQTLKAAGFRGDLALTVFIGAKVLLLVCMPLVAAVAFQLLGVGPLTWKLGLAAATICGLLLPDLIARQLRKRYLRELERGLPDALDLMVICSEAGLALEATVERVAIEIRPAHRAVAAEFAVCSSELRILTDRRAALINMAERTRLNVLRRFGMTLAQTLQYGTPLTQALRTLAAEMRHEQLVRFEAKAARLPVLLTVPMITCILPTLFLVVAGPAMLQVMRLW